MKIKKICEICELEFFVSPSKHKARFCSKICSGKARLGDKNPNFGKGLKGTNNPAYGRKLTAEQKYKCGSANRGKIFDEKRRKNISEGHKGLRLGSTHSEEVKIIIGEYSKVRRKDPEFNKKLRKSMEDVGHWVPLKDKKPIELYKKEANWKNRMFDYIEDPNQLQLLAELKVFNNKTNVMGVVRDHRYSRNSGFYSNVPPILLRHPCNCEIITHVDNVKKKNSRYIDSDSISLQELIKLIISYNGKYWPEHQQCLDIINERYVI